MLHIYVCYMLITNCDCIFVKCRFVTLFVCMFLRENISHPDLKDNFATQSFLRYLKVILDLMLCSIFCTYELLHMSWPMYWVGSKWFFGNQSLQIYINTSKLHSFMFYQCNLDWRKFFYDTLEKEHNLCQFLQIGW